jgi:DNA adenine methylase
MTKPVIKYQGGKTKELPLITKLAPSYFERTIEPFCGGAAVSLYYEKPCVLNDINALVINLYTVIQGNQYSELQKKVNEIKCYDHDQLEEIYYSSRNIINDPDAHSEYEKALAYVVVRQLCFSGMERYNADGKFNVPFGHYKRMSCNLSPKHHTFFSSYVTLKNTDAIQIIEQASENDFIFLDPPYLNRLGYSTGDGSEDDLHSRLVTAMKQTKAKWLLVHSDCEFYREELKDYDIQTESFKYSQIFGKNKDHSGAKVEHLYIRNYN